MKMRNVKNTPEVIINGDSKRKHKPVSFEKISVLMSHYYLILTILVPFWFIIPSLVFLNPNKQGCALRNITRSPKVPNYEIHSQGSLAFLLVRENGKTSARAKRRRGAEGEKERTRSSLPFCPSPSLCSRARFLALPD